MNQIISIADAYAYPLLVWGIYVEQVSKARDGRATDHERLAASLQRAPVCLKALCDLSHGPWLCGKELSLADLHLAPMIDYFMQAPSAAGLMAGVSDLASWWRNMAARPSMAATAPSS